MRKLFSIAIMIALLLFNTSSRAEIASGTCTENISWTLSDDGVLKITGSGDMPDFNGSTPWQGSEISIYEVEIGEGVTSVGDWAFNACCNLKSVNMPVGITSIGNGAFYGCSSLSSIKIPKEVTYIGYGAFSGCSTLYGIIIPEGVTIINNATFRGCSNLYYVIIPEGVTSIGDRAFSGCSCLSSVNIPNSVTVIGSNAFSGCNFTSINIPEGVTSIGYSAFSGCHNLTSINIPEGVTTIKKDTFNGCTSLKSVIIPASVTTIEECAFFLCYVHYVTCKSYNPPTMGYNAFMPYITSFTIYRGAYEAYKKDASWSKFIDYVLFMNDETDIKSVNTRGVMVNVADGVVTLCGLDSGESVSFYTTNGQKISSVKAVEGVASCATSEKIIVAKVGELSISIMNR